MVKFIGGIVIFVCVVIVAFWLISKVFGKGDKSNKSLFNVVDLNENDLINSFNSYVSKLCKAKKTDTIDSIADKLVALLKEYKNRKIEQFVETTQMLTKNKNHLNMEIAKIDSQITKLKADAKALVKENMTKEDYEMGGMYMVQIDETERLKKELQATAVENDVQLERVDKQVKSFNAKYTLKEGSITNMIIKAKTHKNLSDVDLKLNDLISEFNDKVQDVEIEQRVKSQIHGVEEQNDTGVSPTFMANKEDYINRFKNMISA